MFHHADKRLSGLLLFLCEQTSKVPQGVVRIFMENSAKISRSDVRYKSR